MPGGLWPKQVKRASRPAGSFRQNFDQLAAVHGDRWAELPFEATLLLGDVLARAWPAIQTGRQQELTTLLRIARQRYVRDGIGEPAVLTPLVELICQNWPELRKPSRYATSSEIQAIILEWLRGLIWQQAGPDPLRARLRDMLLERSDNPPDDFEVEALALLGPDLNNRAERQLRNFAEAAPSRLAPSVEQFLAVISLARRSPELLAELTEAYYIESPVNDGPTSLGSITRSMTACAITIGRDQASAAVWPVGTMAPSGTFSPFIRGWVCARSIGFSTTRRVPVRTNFAGMRNRHSSCTRVSWNMNSISRVLVADAASVMIMFGDGSEDRRSVRVRV